MLIVKGLLLCLILSIGKADEDDGVTVEVEEEPENESPEIPYTPPVPVGSAYFSENFDDPEVVWKNWVISKAKKDIEDSELAKYNGRWNIQSAIRDPISGDNGLVVSLPAKHSAISAKLNKPFTFDNKPLIVQYEVIFQEGQECGGAYMKLLTGETSLSAFHDKTPYTIMFGPDKCGNDLKLHFIFQHKNPKTGELTEKHAKRPISKLADTFKDKKPHLYTLIVRPDNSYEISVDRNIVSEGNLLTDFTPPVNPPEEIDDPSDKKPEDWDEREKVPDPTAVKPDDWDENEPKEIPDEDAEKPSDWLEEEAEMVPDPTSVMPDDWDEEMDGEWEAPLINNPKCEKVSGCGEWKRPMKPNPKYKGKWSSPIIDNPNYKGKWKPRKIPNPDYFYDDNPFRMAPIDAIGFELWSVSSGIYFDNIIITDDKTVAEQWAQQGYDLKLLKIDKDSVGLVKQFWKYTNKHPWLWAVYVVVIGLPLVLIISFCLPTKSSQSKSDEQTLKDRKKTDEPTPDDEEEAEEKPEDHSKSDDEGVANDSQEEIDDSLTGGGDSGKGSPRKRKNRKEM